MVYGDVIDGNAKALKLRIDLTILPLRTKGERSFIHLGSLALTSKATSTEYLEAYVRQAVPHITLVVPRWSDAEAEGATSFISTRLAGLNTTNIVLVLNTRGYVDRRKHVFDSYADIFTTFATYISDVVQSSPKPKTVMLDISHVKLQGYTLTKAYLAFLKWLALSSELLESMPHLLEYCVKARGFGSWAVREADGTWPSEDVCLLNLLHNFKVYYPSILDINSKKSSDIEAWEYQRLLAIRCIKRKNWALVSSAPSCSMFQDRMCAKASI